MKASRDKLFIVLKDMVANRFITEKKLTKEIYSKLIEKYNMKPYRAQSFMSLQMEDIYSDYDLFCFADIFGEITDDNIIGRYYTDEEIERYGATKYKAERLQFPIDIRMIRITDEQFIGNVNASTLKQWDAAMLINYNENTQRTMRRIINGATEIYKISINRNAVEQIKALLKSKSYFPDPITLNIPQSDYEESEFTYSEEQNLFRIRSLKKFDIIDGYHRFVAISECMGEDPKFDCIMELRITNWTEEQCQQFIFQQDQKTKMKKSESKSFNQDSPANRVVTRICQQKNYMVADMIKKNGGKISFAEMTTAVEKIWFRKYLSDKDEKKLIFELPREIGTKFDFAYENNSELFDKHVGYGTLYILLYLISIHVSDDVYMKAYEELSQRLSEIKITASTSSRRFTNELQNLAMQYI